MNLSVPNRLAPFCLSLALTFASPVHAVSPKEAALRSVGRKTILAIANSDSAYISSITDPQGIYVGYDGIKRSAASFRNDLANHTGLYCDLFEKDCKTDHNPAYTLGHSLNPYGGGGPLAAGLQFKIDKDNGTLVYSEQGGGDTIATLSFRFAGGKWYLCNIYFV